jgi:hypothetical protein
MDFSFIDELDETENQFILFVSIIHWFGSPKKWLQKFIVMGKGMFE